ncbi:MAG: hypothetical protein M3416_04990 [Acidobacteriota bacterium]|nr:hypothetical protein [Acidobacteriota bacterium]
MQDKQAIAFTTTLTKRDWDADVSGWRCPALKIPGAKVVSVFVSGERADSSWYEADYELNVVRWSRPQRPPQATILIKLTEELSTQELTRRWKKLAIIFPLVSSVVAALIVSLSPHIFTTRTQPSGNFSAAGLASTCAEQVKIIVPADNAAVPQSVKVIGKYQNLPEGQRIWVMVYPTDTGNYYPQDPVKEQPDNTWTCDAFVGHGGDVGRIFFIQVVLADRDAQGEFNTYVNRVKETNDSPGMKVLPKGTQPCTSVRVRRK